MYSMVTATPAMQLHCVLADEAAGIPDLHFRCGDGASALAGIFLLHHHRGEHRHGARLFERDEHVGCGVLEYLEAADMRAELVAYLHVFDGRLVHVPHHADGFCAQGRNGFLDDARDHREGLVAGADQGGSRDTKHC